jgi:hypothetical protein
VVRSVSEGSFEEGELSVWQKRMKKTGTPRKERSPQWLDCEGQPALPEQRRRFQRLGSAEHHRPASSNRCFQACQWRCNCPCPFGYPSLGDDARGNNLYYSRLANRRPKASLSVRKCLAKAARPGPQTLRVCARSQALLLSLARLGIK